MVVRGDDDVALHELRLMAASSEGEDKGLEVVPGFTTFLVLIFTLEGMMNCSLKCFKWSFASSD